MGTTPESKITENGFFTGATELAKYLVSNGEALQKAKTEALNAIVEVDGVKFYWDRNNYCYRQLKPIVPDDAPVPEPLVFFTLDGIIDYIRENVEGLVPSSDGPERLILQVVNQNTVRLLSHPSTNKKTRNVIAICEAHVPNITFERYMDTESFNTMLLSNFIETDARAELFKVVKSLTKEQGANVSDDGVSQVLTVRQGVSLASNTQFKNPVPLKPMRTFAEVDQPESNFTLRVNENASAALFEADGGAWKNKAVSLVKEYLRANLSGYGVVVIA